MHEAAGVLRRTSTLRFSAGNVTVQRFIPYEFDVPYSMGPVRGRAAGGLGVAAG